MKEREDEEEQGTEQTQIAHAAQHNWKETAPAAGRPFGLKRLSIVSILWSMYDATSGEKKRERGKGIPYMK